MLALLIYGIPGLITLAVLRFYVVGKITEPWKWLVAFVAWPFFAGVYWLSYMLDLRNPKEFTGNRHD